jgi:hypothetical protein
MTDMAMTVGDAIAGLDNWYALTDATKEAIIVTLLRDLVNRYIIYAP